VFKSLTLPGPEGIHGSSYLNLSPPPGVLVSRGDNSSYQRFTATFTSLRLLNACVVQCIVSIPHDVIQVTTPGTWYRARYVPTMTFNIARYQQKMYPGSSVSSKNVNFLQIIFVTYENMVIRKIAPKR
jgi:hypothetical protein